MVLTKICKKGISIDLISNVIKIQYIFTNFSGVYRKGEALELLVYNNRQNR